MKIPETKILTRSVNSGLVGWWPLNEGGGQIAFNKFNSSNPGTLTNGATFRADLRGKTATFDGTNDYIPCVNNASITGTYPVTLTCWYRLLGVISGEAVLVSIVNPANLNEFWMSHSAGSGFRTVAQSGGTNRSKAAGVPANTDWHFACAIFRDTTNHSIYFDGIDMGGGYGGSAVTPTGLTRVMIGGFIYNISSFYSTSVARNISDVRIFNRALLHNDIWDLYISNKSKYIL